jgi:TonB family protein
MFDSMRLRNFPILALFLMQGQCEAQADVVIHDVRPYHSVTLVPGKVTIEPFICPFSGERSRCPTQAKPRGVPSNWLTIDDYPSRARHANQSGAVELQLQIDREIGRPSACRIIQSSGFELLDRESCKSLQRRARFWPQPAPKGSTIPLYFNVRIVWLAPWEKDM